MPSIGNHTSTKFLGGVSSPNAARGIKYHFLASRRTVTICAIAWAFATILLSTAFAQTYSVIHNFTGGPGGQAPSAGVVLDRAGNLYGTTAAGGGGSCSVSGTGCGIVFKFTPSNGHFETLWQFTGGTDGASPYAGLIVGPGGVLYGSTAAGGGGSCAFRSLPGCGMIFRLLPPVSPPHSIQDDHWIEDVLYRFHGSDGSSPLGDLVMDHSGSIYGSAVNGGSLGFGVVFKLTLSNGIWDESVLHNFDGSTDGSGPNGTILDASGNIFGTTTCCGLDGGGTVYELLAGSGWTEHILYSFFTRGLGHSPYSGVTFDSSGNLYSTTSDGDGGHGGTAFELSSGSLSFHLLYSFSGLAGPKFNGRYGLP